YDRIVSETERWNAAHSHIEDSVFKLDTSFTAFFIRMQSETLTATQTFQTSFQNAITQVDTGLGSALADLAVKGDYFGRSMYKVAQKMLSDFINVITQLAAKKLEIGIATDLGLIHRAPQGIPGLQGGPPLV